MGHPKRATETELPPLYRIETDPLVGRRLDGRFTLTAPIGSGAMGTVYRAVQHPIGREVAVKVLHPQLAADSPHLAKRFLREARLAGRIAHPNVMAVLDMGETEDGLHYLVAELLHGRTLAEALADEGVFDMERVVRVGAQLAAALAAAHAQSIVHRDLKPANVMLLDGPDDPIRVLDFGVSKSLAVARRGTVVTEVHDLIGTPAYMAPEICSGRSADARADLYSLGVMLYELASGALPFRAKTTTEMLTRHVFEPAPPLDGPRWLARLVAGLLAKHPEDRPPSALAVLTELLAGRPGRGTIRPPWAPSSSR